MSNEKISINSLFLKLIRIQYNKIEDTEFENRLTIL